MNPFIISGYESPEYFCDREVESKELINAIDNSRNVTLISERRYGKTSLLNHVEYLLSDKVIFIYIDLYPTLQLKDFIQILSGKIVEKLEPFSDKVIRKITKFFAAFKPRFSFDPTTGAPNLELSVSSKSEAEKSISLLFEYIRNSEKKVVIAFDEFQQILKYPEKNIEALLRSEIQKDNKSCFIFSGSQTHILISIFNAYSRPFYNSTQTMNLKKIEKNKYANFIIANFESYGFQVDNKIANYIYEVNNGVTYNVQYHCNKLFSKQEKVISQIYVDETLHKILKENEVVYFNYRDLLTNFQFKIVKSIAKETFVEKPFSNEFISKYNLGPASSVRTAIKSLSEKGVLINHKGVHLSDWFFSLWLKYQP